MIHFFIAIYISKYKRCHFWLTSVCSRRVSNLGRHSNSNPIALTTYFKTMYNHWARLYRITSQLIEQIVVIALREILIKKIVSGIIQFVVTYSTNYIYIIWTTFAIRLDLYAIRALLLKFITHPHCVPDVVACLYVL